MIVRQPHYKNKLAHYLPYFLAGGHTGKNLSGDTWQQTSLLLDHHGLIPFFLEFGGLEQHSPPKGVVVQLKQKAQHIAARNLTKIKVQQELSKELKNKGIPFLFIKGTQLSTFLYGNPVIRPLLDLDLLLHPERVEEVRRLLLQNGGKETMGLQNKFVQDHQKHSQPILFQQVIVEIHTALLKTQAGRKASKPWDHIIQKDFSGQALQVFHPPFYLAYLCHHAFHHLQMGKFKLLWLVDMACMAQQYMDEENVTEAYRFAQQWHIEKEVYCMVRLVAELFFCEIPYNKNLGYEKGYQKTKARLIELSRKTSVHVPLSYYSGILSGLGPIEKIKYLLSLAFPSREYIKQKSGISHPFLLCMARCLNPFRVTAKWLAMALRPGNKAHK
jgi:hypothetical protein